MKAFFVVDRPEGQRLGAKQKHPTTGEEIDVLVAKKSEINSILEAIQITNAVRNYIIVENLED